MKLLKYYIFVSFLLVFAGTSHALATEGKCEGQKLVVLGDSLVAGYGLAPGAAFPDQLGRKLAERGYQLEIVNAGVSGDTTSGGLSRLDWSVGEGTDGVILELGANDALRGISPDVTEKNLDMMISKLKERGIKVLLAGMMAPPNMGASYGKAFNGIYERLAEKHGVYLYPFFLDGVAANPELNQPDGIHPTREGIAVIVERMLPSTQKFIDEICS